MTRTIATRFLIVSILICCFGGLSAKVGYAQDATPTAILPPLLDWSGDSEELIVDADDPWITPSEASGLTETPTYAETMAWLERLAEATPRIHLALIGSSLEQRDIVMVVATSEGSRTPTELRENGKPTLLVHAGIHSGEIDGKDAGLMLLRDLTVGDRLDLLNEVNLLFIPILNVDGHERSSPFNRINQRGPASMGWRTNARNRNLNRDFSKLDTEEVAALVVSINVWDPDLYLDLHVTDGADYQSDITFGYNGQHAWSPQIAGWLDESYRPIVDQALIDAGHIPAPLLFSVGEDMKSGNYEWTASPRFSTGYSDVRHLPHVLLENHSLKPYRQRVLGTYVFVEASMRALAAEYEDLRRRVAADRSRLPDPMPLDWASSGSPVDTMVHQGIKSDRFESEISGGEVVRWLGEPVEMSIPVFGAREPAELTDRPEAYYIPAGWSDVINRLIAHGVEMERTLEPQSVRAMMYRLPDAKLAETVFEGRVRLTPGNLVPEEHDLELPPGSYIVRTNQDLGDLVMILLEPNSPDSFLQWGFFPEILHRTEYVEPYVMEPTAAAMLEADPELRSEFEARVESDSAFAANPNERLQWFYKRTPYYDNRYRLYPVGRSLR